MPKFMVALRGNPADWKALSPSDIQKIMERYADWSKRLRDENRFDSGYGLSYGSVQLVPEAGAVRRIDGPYAETKEALTGYFVISAETLEEAVTIARGCPALTHGESVEIIQASE